jgi:hypothetical protein
MCHDEEIPRAERDLLIPAQELPLMIISGSNFLQCPEGV